MTSHKHAPRLRAGLVARLLGGASMAVIASYTPALAQDLNITIDSAQGAPASAFTAANVTGYDTVNTNTQDARANVTASIDDGVLNSDIGGSDSSSVEIADNNLSATASGNTFSLTAEKLGTDGSGTGGTLGLLSGQFANSTIRSSVADSSLTIDSTSGTGDAANTSLAASDNTISAGTTVNRATVVFSDEISADLAGDLAGSGEGFSQAEGETITLTRGDLTEQELLSVDGGASVVASTQAMEGVALSSVSTVGGSTISVELGDSIGSADADDSLVTVDGNDLRSSVAGNVANVGTDVTVDTAFDGSAGVFNQQQIGEGGTPAGLVSNTNNSALSVTLGDSTNSSLVVSDNTIGSSARGNVATLDGTGADSTLADGTSLSIDATSITADANGGRININDGGTTEFTDDQTPADGTNFGFVAGTQQAIDSGTGGQIGAANNANNLSVTATGELTGSSISVEDNTAFAIASANDAGTAIDLNATNITATAGLASDQSLIGTSVTSSLGGGLAFALSADVDGDVADSAVLVDENLLVAEASGNTGRTTLSADADTALLSSSEIDRATAVIAPADDETTAVGDFALAANQSIVGTGVGTGVSATADSTGTVTIGATDGGGTPVLTGAITDSTVSLSNNVQQATASGNTLSNGIDLDGNTLGAEATNFADNISAVSALASTQQIASVVSATSRNTLSLKQDVFSGTTAVADSSLLIDANENRSSATANRATNTLAVTADTTIVGGDADAASASLVALTSVDAGGTSAVSNFQESTGTTIVADTDTIATLDIGNGGAATTAGLTDSIASISNNITTASGAANIGTSTINLDAGTELTSNAALVNARDSSSEVRGLAVFADTGTAGLEVTGPVANSTVGIDDNTVIASGMGNQTTNTLSVTATTIDRVASTDFGDNFLSEAAPDATADFAALNRQNQSGDITSNATADGLVSIAATGPSGTDGTLTDSRASLNGNQLQSDAMSNLAANSIDLTGTSAINETTVALGSLQTSGTGADAISVNSSSDADFVFQTANGAVTDSSVSIDGNQVFDSATSNQAINTVSLASNSISGEAGTLADVGVVLEPQTSSEALADNSLSSVQTSFAAVGSSSDITGRISSGGQPFSGSNASISDNFARSFGMGNTATNTLDLMAGTSFSGTGALTGTQVQIGDVASAATVGATIIDGGGGSLDNSTAAIDENIAFSRSMGNDQTNALLVEGTSITGVSGSGDGATFAALGDGTNTRTLDADNVVTGFQGLVNGDVTGAATVTGTVDINAPSNGGIITDSSVSASDNIAQSNVTGSRGNNLLELAADTTATGVSVLTSEQSGAARESSVGGNDGNNAITSTADLTFDVDQTGAVAPINSALNVDGNVGFSSAFGNDLTNRLAVSGTSVVGQDVVLSTADVTAAGVVSGTSDNLLGNFQSRVNGNSTTDEVQTAVTSSADLTVNLLENATGATADSTITASDNILDSTATSNRANNTLALNADTALTAGGAIANQQTSDSPVTSEVALRTSVGNIGLGVIEGSSFALRDNTGVARAAGNDATNVLNARAGTVITGGAPGSGSSGVTAGALNATGTFATASNQVNSGAVTARASFGDVGEVTQSSLGFQSFDGAGFNNSSVDLSGNRLVADAVSNRVSNTISVSGRSPSTDVTTALTSRQVATGAVESRVDTFNLASANGSLDASSIGLSGNTFSASAGGNVATSSLIRD